MTRPALRVREMWPRPTKAPGRGFFAVLGGWGLEDETPATRINQVQENRVQVLKSLEILALARLKPDRLGPIKGRGPSETPISRAQTSMILELRPG